MPHHIYETEAFILFSRGVGEANRLYYLFTPQFGLILALAQGVRKTENKLRHHLTDYSLVRIVLIKGREYWRITGSETIFSSKEIKDQDSRRIILRLFAVLRQLLAGPEESHWLFSDLRLVFDYLLGGQLSPEQRANLETIFLLRLLNHLGYLPEDKRFDAYVGGPTFSLENLSEFSRWRSAAIPVINSFFSERGS